MRGANGRRFYRFMQENSRACTPDKESEKRAGRHGRAESLADRTIQVFDRNQHIATARFAQLGRASPALGLLGKNAMRPYSSSILRLLALLAAASPVAAASLTFDFRGAQGLALETSASVALGGLTLTTALFPSGVFNQTTASFGINAVGADESAEFDQGEGFTFSFDQDVTLTSLTVSSFGGASAGTLSVQGGATIASISSTGLKSLDSFFVSSGTTLRFEATGSSAFSLDNLSVSTVPEASTYGLILGLTALVATTRRRRRHRA
jgi:hypothetical protein